MGVYLWELAYRKGIFRTEKLPVPVAGVGSITAGGAGKTPLVLSLLGYLQREGVRVGVLSRGYGRWRSQEKIPFVFQGESPPPPEEIGDEPALMAAKYPEALYCISPDRLEGGKALVSAGVDLILLDDGFQSLELFQDLKIVILPPDIPLAGWGWIKAFLPSGELRDFPGRLLEADLLVCTRGEWEASDSPGPENWYPFLRHLALSQKLPESIVPPVLETTVRMEGVAEDSDRGGVPVHALAGKNVVLVSGIARPDRFSRMLAFYGVRPLGHLALPDHARFSDRDRTRIGKWIDTLEQSSHKKVDTILVTEKDWVKWGREETADPRIRRVLTRMMWIDEDRWVGVLQSRLRRAWTP
jgi:tetraacyldisaccharide 4'-kinase